MCKTVFPEAANLKFPLGTLAQVKETARQDGTTAGEYMRRAVRSALAGAPAGDEGQIIEVCGLAGELSLVGMYEVARLTRDKFSIIERVKHCEKMEKCGRDRDPGSRAATGERTSQPGGMGGL